MDMTRSAVPHPATARAQAHALGEVLRRELDWLAAAIDLRFRLYFESKGADVLEQLPPPAVAPASTYGAMLTALEAGPEERLLLALALAPLVAPQSLDAFLIKNQTTDRGFAEFGGVTAANRAGFLPTGETALFLLAGNDLGARLEALALLEPGQPVFARGPLRLGPAAAGGPPWSGALSFASAELRKLAGSGEAEAAEVEPAQELAARRVTTDLDWQDLVLAPDTLDAVEEIKAWAEHQRTLLEDWKLGRRLRPGYRALFYGPSGTGKTLAAALLGKSLGLEVHRVDLSDVLSRDSGEIERTLAQVFDEAKRRNWILFFDEADAVFGRRTAIAEAHDRYANAQVSYLLQRIEDYPGIAILATNLKSAIDEAFARRFQALVHFAPPDAELRLRLWRDILGERVKVAPDVDQAKLAADYELTGGQIVNVVRHACLRAVRQEDKRVRAADLVDGIRRELRGSGQTD